jgi:hypothetical protein
MTWRKPVALLGLLIVTAAVGELVPDVSQSIAVAQPQPAQGPGMPNQGYQGPGVQMPAYQSPGTPYQGYGAPGMQAPGLQPPGGPGPQLPKETPLDEPLRLIAAAKAYYQQVNSYRCILISQERVKGKLLPESVMELSFRPNPFSVYMKWLGPKDKVGQEVCFVKGRNQDRMRVLPKGMGSFLGWTSFDINNPMVMENSNHVILETGFGNIIEKCEKTWTKERPMAKTVVQIAEYDYNKQRCTRVEATHTVREPGFYSYRYVVYFDNQTHLPIRMESYDWPRPGSPPGGELIETFSYINIEFNVNIPESVFTH